MSLDTRNHPWVLLGDTLADRPAASSSVLEGTYFIDKSTNIQYYLRILAGVKSWQPVGVGPTGGVGVSMSEFSGNIVNATAGTGALFLAKTNASASLTPFRFPMGLTGGRTAIQMSVFLPSAIPGGGQMTVTLMKKNLPVLSLILTPASPTGFNTIAGSVAYAAGDDFDIRVTSDTATAVLENQLAVSVEFTSP